MSNIHQAYSNTLSNFQFLLSITPKNTMTTPYIDNVPIIIDNNLPIGAILHFTILFSSTDMINQLSPSTITLNYMYKQAYYHNSRFRYDLNMLVTPEDDLHSYLLDIGSNSGPFAKMFILESYVDYFSRCHPNRIGMLVKLLSKMQNIRPPLRSVMNTNNHSSYPSLPHAYPRYAYILAYTGGNKDLVRYSDTVYQNHYVWLISTDDAETVMNLYMAHAFTIEFVLPVEFAVLDYSRITGATYNGSTIPNIYTVNNFTQGLTTDYLAAVYSIRIQ